MEDPVKQLGYKRRVSNKPPEPDGSTLVSGDGPSTREVVGNGDAESGGSGILRRILELLEGLAGRGNRDETEPKAKRSFRQKIGRPRADVKTSASDASASMKAARVRAAKRRKVREPEPEAPKPDQEAPKQEASPAAPAENAKSGTSEDQWRQNTDQKLEDLAQMILGLPEDIIKRLQEG